MKQLSVRQLAFLVIGLLLTMATLQVAFARRRPIKAHFNPATAAFSSSSDLSIYDARPDHIWNRLYRHFFVRVAGNGEEFGYDTLDPLLWPSTRYLSSGQSHQQAVDLLDEFLATHAENLITDPLKRAFLQRDLWAVFDIITQGDSRQQGRAELQTRLARVIQRLALTPEQIRLLPDNYQLAVAGKSFPTQYQSDHNETSFLPAEMFRADGPWTAIGTSDRPAAPSHLADMAFAGRSVFLVFLRLPAGRDATIAYLQRLKDFSQPWILNPEKSRPNQIVANPDLPQFPLGTELALVRRMVLIDNQGKLTPTSLTESIQIRVYRSIPNHVTTASEEARASQTGFEFRLSRRKLFAGEAGGLRPVLSTDRDFEIFRSHGIDWFETAGAASLDRVQFAVRDHCIVCHFAPGINSVLSFSATRFQPLTLRPYLLSKTTIANQEEFTAGWKQKQYEWGLLKGLWANAR